MSNNWSVSVNGTAVLHRDTGGAPSEQVVGSTPAVMLSPKATKRVTVSRGGMFTVTPNWQDAVRCRESVAVHVTLVAPIGNVVPLAGAQFTVTGGAPEAPIASG